MTSRHVEVDDETRPDSISTQGEKRTLQFRLPTTTTTHYALGEHKLVWGFWTKIFLIYLLRENEKLGEIDIIILISKFRHLAPKYQISDHDYRGPDTYLKSINQLYIYA